MPGRISKKNIAARDDRPNTVSDGVIPECPEYLSKRQRKIYRKTAEYIVSMNIGGSMDENIIAQYATVVDALQSIEEDIQAHPEKADALNNKKAKFLVIVINLAKELGLTPSSRAKMRVAKLESNEPSIEDTL